MNIKAMLSMSFTQLARHLTSPQKKEESKASLCDLLTKEERLSVTETGHMKKGYPVKIIKIGDRQRTKALQHALRHAGKISVERSKTPKGDYQLVMTPIQWQELQKPLAIADKVNTKEDLKNHSILMKLFNTEPSPSNSDRLLLQTTSRNQAIALQEVFKAAGMKLDRSKNITTNEYAIALTPLQHMELCDKAQQRTATPRKQTKALQFNS